MFWLQTKAPAGNWVDNLGSSDVKVCIEHGRYLAGLKREQPFHRETVRVVERTDVQVWEPRSKRAAKRHDSNWK